MPDGLRKHLETALWSLPTQAQEMGNPSEFSETDGPAFSRTHGDQTQTDAFKRWFGDSKAVDADGSPTR